MKRRPNLWHKFSEQQENKAIVSRLYGDSPYIFSKELDQKLNINDEMIAHLWQQIKQNPEFFKRRNASPKLLAFFKGMVEKHQQNPDEKHVFYHLNCLNMSHEAFEEMLATNERYFQQDQESIIKHSLEVVDELIGKLKQLFDLVPEHENDEITLDLETAKEFIARIADLTTVLSENTQSVYEVAFYKIYRKIALYNTYIYHLWYNNESQLLDIRNVFQTLIALNQRLSRIDQKTINDPGFNYQTEWNHLRLLRRFKIKPFITDLEKYKNNIETLYKTIYSDILQDNNVDPLIFNELVEKSYLAKSTQDPIEVEKYLTIEIYDCQNRFLIWYLQSKLVTIYLQFDNRKDKSLFWLSIILSLSTTLLAFATVAVAIVTGVCH